MNNYNVRAQTMTDSQAATAPRADEPPGRGLSIYARHISLDIQDIWDMIPSALAAPPCFAWSDPGRGLSLLAWGSVADLTNGSTVDERWLGARPAIQAGLPLAVGGQAFTAPQSDAPADDWGGWPSRRLFIPEFLLYRAESGHCGLIMRSRDRHLVAPHIATGGSFRRAPGRLTFQPALDRDGYQHLVQRALNDIRGGKLDKVVVARRVSAAARIDRVASAFAMRTVGATTFVLSFDGHSVFMGATPETLVAATDGVLSTHAVAGTSDRALDPGGAALMRSAKDRQEHALVVDGIQRALQPICDDVRKSPLSVLPAGSVQHLLTPISARLSASVGVLDAVSRLHPTAALCGTPRDAAHAWIAEHEPYRGWYGAPIGWVSGDGDGVFAVAIRSALLTPRRAVAFAGAGIVATSDPAAEWRETEAKLRTATRAIRVAVQPAMNDAVRAS